MNFPIPRIVNATLAEAVAAGCDCVMLKHVGFPISINCAEGIGNVYTAFRFGTLDRELIEVFTYVEPFNALLVGAKDPFTGNIHISDIWWVNGHDVQNLTYRERYVLVRLNIRKLDSRFRIILTYPIQAAHELWKVVMKEPKEYSGLICRRSKDTAAGELYVIRYYETEPRALE